MSVWNTAVLPSMQKRHSCAAAEKEKEEARVHRLVEAC